MGVARQKILGGPTESYGNENIITFRYTNSVQSTLLLGGSGGMPPQENLKTKCYKIESGRNFGQ